MKFTTEWLSEFVALGDAPESLCHRLTMAGLEVEDWSAFEAALEGVVAAQVRTVEAHPGADSLKLCVVEAGHLGVFRVVCGAPNVRPGMLACLAPPGSALTGGVAVSTTQIRGIASEGMLCSAAELGLGEEAAGLLELSSDAIPGTSLTMLCAARDTLIELSLTPNRGDCLSVLGVAREYAALTATELHFPGVPPVPQAVAATFPLSIDAPQACAVYTGRVLEGVNAAAATPLWMRERLRRCGVRSINVVVDITNYVMLALGQPMHAFDLDRLRGSLAVRFAARGESVVLLDGTSPALAEEDLVIADTGGPVALAGVMGGLASGVERSSSRIFLESASFDPVRIAGTARRLRLHTDASHRFERGVDPTQQARAIEMASALLVALCGARPGPLCVAMTAAADAVETPVIPLRLARANSVLGTTIGEAEAQDVLTRLQCRLDAAGEVWKVRPPAFRPDLRREEDLFEELARVRGYDTIPVTSPSPGLRLAEGDPAQERLSAVQESLVGAGYLEAITYSFISSELWAAFGSGLREIALSNPISRELAVMRPSLLPGLLAVVKHNQHRQIASQRVFEVGMVFRHPQSASELLQQNRVAGVAVGQACPEQWGLPPRAADFHDLKQEVVNLLQALGLKEIGFEPSAPPGMHPGATADVWHNGRPLGYLGELHPGVVRMLDLTGTPVAFELDLDALEISGRPAFQPFSRFPSVRRDLAVLVPEEVAAGTVLSLVRHRAGPLLRDLQLFDVYRGQGIDSGKKSLALGLLFQAPSSTLVDSQVEALVSAVLEHLGRELGASLRH